MDIRDNPNLTLPPKPTEEVKGSGAEWYNIDFDPEILKKGAVVATAKVIKGQWGANLEDVCLYMYYTGCICSTFLQGLIQDRR